MNNINYFSYHNLIEDFYISENLERSGDTYNILTVAALGIDSYIEQLLIETNKLRQRLDSLSEGARVGNTENDYLYTQNSYNFNITKYSLRLEEEKRCLHLLMIHCLGKDMRTKFLSFEKEKRKEWIQNYRNEDLVSD